MPSRKKTVQACDRCHRQRSRCDGGQPCARCIEYDSTCSYDRLIRRRGRKARTQSAPHDDGSFLRAAETDPRFVASHASQQRLTTQASPHSWQSADLIAGHGQHNNYTVVTDTDTATPDTLYSGLVQTHSLDEVRGPASLAPRHDRWITVNGSHEDTARDTLDQPGTEITRAGIQYPCIRTLYPRLSGVLDPQTACDLLNTYFAQPCTNTITCCPYVIAPVLRQHSLTRPNGARPISILLLITILWVCAQTADLPALLVPRRRKTVCARLRRELFSLISEHDPSLFGDGIDLPTFIHPSQASKLSTYARESGTSAASTSCHDIDQLLSATLITIVISGGDEKRDTIPWYQMIIRMVKDMRLHRLDDDGLHPTNLDDEEQGLSRDMDESCYHEQLSAWERREERRRLFWLIFALDRHWSLCYNSLPMLLDQECEVFQPLADGIWNNPVLDVASLQRARSLGPQLRVSGTDCFQFFLPLMATLGDIVWVHHQNNHPRLHALLGADSTSRIASTLEQYLCDIKLVRNRCRPSVPEGDHSTLPLPEMDEAFELPGERRRCSRSGCATSAIEVALLYAEFITHVEYVLLHGRWDALDLLSSGATSSQPSSALADVRRLRLSEWVTSEHFGACASHAISASEILAGILILDPELTHMPYLFGIYLLHGSFILLFFADRMPQIGEKPDEAVERACETIIRAHEISVATLSVEYQKHFRKALRLTLEHGRRNHHNVGEQCHGNGRDHLTGRLEQSEKYPLVRNSTSGVDDASLARTRRYLDLYRWADGHEGLAL